MADWTLGTSRDDHLDEHNLFDHDGIATPTAGKILGVSGGKYTQVEAGTGNHDTLIGVSADDHHNEDHQARHQTAGADALTGNLDAVARTNIAKNGSPVGARRQLNLIEGSNVTLTVADDGGNEEIDITIASTGGSGTGGMPVFYYSVDHTVTESGIYIVNSSTAIRTITLPALSTLGSAGMRVIVKREGANYVDVDCNAADDFEPGSLTTQRLFTNWSAISLAGSSSGNYWYELGFYGSVT